MQMSFIDEKSRRSFLKSLAMTLCAQQLLNSAKAAEQTAKQAKYKLAAWTGDEFTLGHRLRIGDLPPLPEKAERKVDFVIVGGGISGLTAAFNLKDQDFLLLEQYADLGGHARGSSYKGIDYSYAAAYIGEVDGYFGELYSQLGISPVKLETNRNQFYYNNEWFVSAEGDKSKPIYKEFARLIEEAKPIWAKMPHDDDPVKLSSGEMETLDKSLFSDYLKGYSPEFISVLNAFFRSSFGGGSDQLSALSAFALLEDLVVPTYVFKGGNPAIGRALSAKLNAAGSKRCLNNAFVWKIEIKDSGASVVYGLADGSTHRVDCRHVIVATPPLVASRQLAKIPDALKAELFKFKYCSYLVANILMPRKLFDGKYDCFTGAPFSFADITVAETPYMLSQSYKPEMGSVLTIYQPYPAGSEGRPLLMIGDREMFASKIVGELDKLQADLSGGIEEVVLSRWGHALALTGPGYFAGLARLQKLQEGDSYSLAHSNIYGWPAAETAITAGRDAAVKAKKLAARPSFLIQ